MAPIKEITLAQLNEGWSDWAHVFGEASDGNTNNITEPIPPGSEIDLTPATRADVAEIIAAVNGENEGPDWIGVFLLRDGRYLVAQGGCDYTGWECCASNIMHVAKTLDDAIQFGLREPDQQRLGFREGPPNE